MLYELGLHRIELPGDSPDLTPDSRIILWHQNLILMNGSDIAWSAIDISLEYHGLQFVAKLNGHSYFTAVIKHSTSLGEYKSLRDIAFIGETQFMLCARAKALFEWEAQHKFCSQCGQPVSQVAKEVAKTCNACNLRFYPKISPCVITIVTKGRQILLAQSERHKEQGWYGAIAGFIESGESAEQAVLREVKEEVNLIVKNIRYMNSQAWPFPNQLMLGYLSEYESGQIVPEAGEIADAQWFDIDDLPKHPPGISIAGWLIRQYQEQFRRG